MPAAGLSSAGKMLVTTFGLGHMRPASGTWGSMPTVAIAGVLIGFGLRPCGAGLWEGVVYHAVLLGVLLFFSWVCVAFGDGAEVVFGEKDPSQVVADETAGQAIPLLALPAAATATPEHALIALGAAFVAFRVFDILKLWPANGLQSRSGGWGILLDDLAAGVQAMVVVQIVLRVMWGS